MVDPSSGVTTRIEIRSSPERHTINRAELAAIAVTLRTYRDRKVLRILTDSAFCILNISKFATCPASFATHTHLDLLRVVDDYLREREARQYLTRIGKVKSHTNIEYNDAADAGAKDVATGKVPPDIIFDEADPEMRGLRTCLIQHHTDSQGREREIVLKDLKAAVKPLAQKAGKEAIQTRTTFGTLLREAIAQGADFSVQPASAATHKQRAG